MQVSNGSIVLSKVVLVVVALQLTGKFRMHLDLLQLSHQIRNALVAKQRAELRFIEDFGSVSLSFLPNHVLAAKVSAIMAESPTEYEGKKLKAEILRTIQEAFAD